MLADMLEFELAFQGPLEIEVRKPIGLKIGDYLEKYKEITYNYDFGGNWCLTI